MRLIGDQKQFRPYLSPPLRYGDLSVRKLIFLLPYFCLTPNLKMFSLYWITGFACYEPR